MATIRPVSTAILHHTSKHTPRLQQFQASYLTSNPTLRPTNHDRHHNTQQRRTFLSGNSNPFSSSPQVLKASRTLHYPRRIIYEVIADVASYSNFIPYCQSSSVTKYSSPTAADGKKYPEEAKLVIGFNGDVSEEFWSRVYCVPDTTVEAVSGAYSETSLTAGEIEHHSRRPAPEDDKSRNATILSHLRTRWILRPFPYKPPPTAALDAGTAHKNHDETSHLSGQEKVDVSLKIEYQFANPMYAALSAAAAPRVADKMIEAFEKRVRAVIDGPSHAHTR
ncbi:Coenzyme Q-binding protein coq10, mitochondrial [Vermiconidia calcicola]|uniref:Coenzyme Q-binding protein coq10, mitochondrial n=1 Tax=Vermiconidia calcicola TaxID=1690605 RepID=A0ACC3MTM5_9PEZI|nr:Coenzyme Q-binding protein coq10, mitochondrial [Vermiconidia calcicola]